MTSLPWNISSGPWRLQMWLRIAAMPLQGKASMGRIIQYK